MQIEYKASKRVFDKLAYWAIVVYYINRGLGGQTSKC